MCIRDRRKTKGVIVMDDDHIVLSALQPETIARRVSNDSEYLTKEEDDMDE